MVHSSIISAFLYQTYSGKTSLRVKNMQFKKNFKNLKKIYVLQLNCYLATPIK